MTWAQVAGFITVTRDITEHLAAEQRQQARVRDLQAQVAARSGELQDSEARLDGFIRHVPAAIAFKGLDGRLLMVNRRAEAMHGHAASAALGLAPRRLPPELAVRTREQDERVLERREELQQEQTLDLPDGSTRDFLTQKFPLVDAGGHGWGLGVIATDITERKQAERADLQRQKLESLGLLAGGSPTTSTTSWAPWSATWNCSGPSRPPGAGDARLRALEQLLQRASSLVAQILAYTGKGTFQVQALDLNIQVEEMIRLLRASLSRNASLRGNRPRGCPP